MPDQITASGARAAGTLIDQGVLGALLVLALIALGLSVYFWQKAVGRCSESERAAAALRDALQEKRVTETAVREATLSKLLSENASSNVDRTNTLNAVVEGLAKVGTALEMLIAEKKSARERLMDRVLGIESTLKSMHDRQEEIQRELVSLLAAMRLEAAQKVGS